MRLFLAALFFICGCSPATDSPKVSITVFAAASLTDVIQELVRLFELQEPNITVHTHIGPTSLLARQIQQGAPADLFLSASPEWTEFLRKRNLVIGSEISFTGNTLVVLGSTNTQSVSTLLEFSSEQRLAMADPTHVPAGVYGKQALQCTGEWDAFEPRILPTLDVRAALTAVQSGAAELAMVYGSDVTLAPDLNVVFEVPDSCMPEIKYTLCIIRGTSSPESATLFATFIADSSQLGLWERFGFQNQ